MALLAPARASACKYADTSPTWRDAKSRCPISLTISSEALVGSRSARDRTACVRTMVSGSARAVSSKSSESLPPISASERTVSRLRRVDRGASWCGVRSLLPSGRQFYRPGGRCSLLHTIDDPQCTCAADPRWAPSPGKEHSAGTCATAAHRPRSVFPADEESCLALILPAPPEGLPGLQGGCQILLRSVKLSGLCQTAGECTDLTFSGLAVDGDGPDTVTEHQKRHAIACYS